MPLKITKSDLENLLSKLGVPPVEIVDEADPETEIDIDSIIGEVDKSREQVYKAKYGESIADEKVKKVVGKLTGSLMAIAKRESGLKDVDFDGKGIEDVIKLAIDSVKTKGSSSAEEVRSEMNKVISEWENKYQSVIRESQDKEAALVHKFEQAEIDKLILNHVQKAPISKGDKAKISSLVKNSILERADIIRKDDKLELRTKENKELPVLVGNTIKTFEDALKEDLEALGLWETDTRAAIPPKTTSSSVYIGNNNANDFAEIEAQLQAL